MKCRQIGSLATLLIVTFLAAPHLVAQARAIPIRSLSAPVVSPTKFPNSLLGVGELADGRVLVRDNSQRILSVFDSTLNPVSLLADAMGKSSAAYPAGAGFVSAPIPYRGDTLVLIDLNVPGFVAVTPQGKMGSVMSHPAGKQLSPLLERQGATVGFDNRGRFIYREIRGAPSGDKFKGITSRDTLAILRADLDQRKVDTVATYGVPVSRALSYTTDPNSGKRLTTQTINPYPMGPDGWAVLSNGTLGIVRAHDYHVDWIKADGNKTSSAKLPFDWKPFTDTDKRARTDSMKHLVDSLSQLKNSPYAQTLMIRRDIDGKQIGVDTVKPTTVWVPLSEMPDYFSPLSDNSVSADRDGNLWIIPTTSSAAQNGVLYDVVSEKDGLRERVQAPSGCRVVGFGKRSVVFLACQSEGQWALQRRTVVR